MEAGNLKRAHLYEYKVTGYFIFACIVAALGGSLFGYDLGVSGQFSGNAFSAVFPHGLVSSTKIRSHSCFRPSFMPLISHRLSSRTLYLCINSSNFRASDVLFLLGFQCLHRF